MEQNKKNEIKIEITPEVAGGTYSNLTRQTNSLLTSFHWLPTCLRQRFKAASSCRPKTQKTFFLHFATISQNMKLLLAK